MANQRLTGPAKFCDLVLRFRESRQINRTTRVRMASQGVAVTIFLPEADHDSRCDMFATWKSRYLFLARMIYPLLSLGFNGPQALVCVEKWSPQGSTKTQLQAKNAALRLCHAIAQFRLARKNLHRIFT